MFLLVNHEREKKGLVSQIMKQSMTRPYQPNEKSYIIFRRGFMPTRPFARYLELHGEYQLRDSNSLKCLIFISQLCNMQIHRGHAEVTLKKSLEINLRGSWRFFDENQSVMDRVQEKSNEQPTLGSTEVPAALSQAS